MAKISKLEIIFGWCLLLLAGCFENGQTGSRGNLAAYNSGAPETNNFDGSTSNIAFDAGSCSSIVTPSIVTSNQTFSVQITALAGTAPYTLVNNSTSFTSGNSTTFSQVLSNPSSVNQLQTQSVYYRDSAGLIGVCNYSVTVSPCTTGGSCGSTGNTGPSQMTGCTLEMTPSSVLNGKTTRARIHPVGTTSGYLIASISGPSFFRDVAVVPAIDGIDAATRVDHVVKFLRPGSYQITAKLIDYNSSDRKEVQCSASVTSVANNTFATGQIRTGASTSGGSITVNVYKGMNLTPMVSFSPFSDLTSVTAMNSSVRSAMGDVNADGVSDLIVGVSPDVINIGTITGDTSRIRIYNGTGFGLLKEIVPFGGGNSLTAITAGDVDGDGYCDIVAANSVRVEIYSGRTYDLLRSFSSALSTGHLAAGDYDGDGRSDISTGSISTTQFRVYTATSIMASNTAGSSITPWLDSYSTSNGVVPVTVASGDVNGDGFAEMAFGTNMSTISKVRLFNASVNFVYQLFAELVPFLTSGGSPIYGINWASFSDVNSDGFDDLLVGGDYAANSNPNVATQTPEVKAWSGQNSFGKQLLGPSSTGGLRLYPYGNTFNGRVTLSIGM